MTGQRGIHAVTLTSFAVANQALLPPTNLTHIMIENRPALSWTAPDFDVALTGELIQYHVYRDSVAVAQVQTTSHTDMTNLAAGTYLYFVVAEYALGMSGPSNEISAVVATTSIAEEAIIPLITALKGNYPNPFNPETTISFSVGTQSHTENIQIDIFNIKGQKIRNLLDDTFSPGQHKVVWNGTNDNGQAVPSGIYFYRMKAGDYQSVKRMMLLK
jgi:hypothetical protein